MRSHFRFLFGAVTGALLATASHAAAAPSVGSAAVPTLAVAGPVRAGDRIELRWTQADPRAEECELLLSLDGGRTWSVRVSPELPGDETRYRWRVPNLASADARIRLRVRIDGHEREYAASAAFAIETDPTRPLEHSLFNEGSWWDGLETRSSVPAGFGAAGGASLGVTHATLASEEAPRLSYPCRGLDATTTRSTPVRARPAGREDDATGVTRRLPLRN